MNAIERGYRYNMRHVFIDHIQGNNRLRRRRRRRRRRGHDDDDESSSAAPANADPRSLTCSIKIQLKSSHSPSSCQDAMPRPYRDLRTRLGGASSSLGREWNESKSMGFQFQFQFQYRSAAQINSPRRAYLFTDERGEISTYARIRHRRSKPPRVA